MKINLPVNLLHPALLAAALLSAGAGLVFGYANYNECRCNQGAPYASDSDNIANCCSVTSSSWYASNSDKCSRIYVYHTYVNNSYNTVTVYSSPAINPCTSADAASVCYTRCVGPYFGVPYCGSNPSTGTDWKDGDHCNRSSFTSCLTTTADSCDTYKIVGSGPGGPLSPRRCAATAADCDHGATVACVNGPDGDCFQTGTAWNCIGGYSFPAKPVECYAYQCYCAFYVNNYAYCG